MQYTLDGWRDLQAPPATDTYTPVSNRALLDAISDSFSDDDHMIRFISAKYDKRYPFSENYAILRIEYIGADKERLEEERTSTYKRALLAVNSGDKSRKVTIVLGASTEGGTFIPGGGTHILRKHTKNVHDDLLELLRTLVTVYQSSYRTAMFINRKLTGLTLRDEELYPLIGLLVVYMQGKAKLLNGPQITQLINVIQQKETYPRTHGALFRHVFEMVYRGNATYALNKLMMLSDILKSIYVDGDKILFTGAEGYYFVNPLLINRPKDDSKEILPSKGEIMEIFPTPEITEITKIEIADDW